MTTPAMTAAEETYDDVRKLIYHSVQKFVRCHEGSWDVEELESVAHSWYMRAVHTYRNNTGAKFSTWVRTMVWCGLQQHTRKLVRWSERNVLGLDGDQCCHQSSDIVDDIEGNAYLVFQTIQHLPDEVHRAMCGKKLLTRQRILSDYLWERGLTATSIWRAFNEVQSILKR